MGKKPKEKQYAVGYVIEVLEHNFDQGAASFEVCGRGLRARGKTLAMALQNFAEEVRDYGAYSLGMESQDTTSGKATTEPKYPWNISKAFQGLHWSDVVDENGDSRARLEACFQPYIHPDDDVSRTAPDLHRQSICAYGFNVLEKLSEEERKQMENTAIEGVICWDTDCAQVIGSGQTNSYALGEERTRQAADWWMVALAKDLVPSPGLFLSDCGVQMSAIEHARKTIPFSAEGPSDTKGAELHAMLQYMMIDLWFFPHRVMYDLAVALGMKEVDGGS